MTFLGDAWMGHLPLQVSFLELILDELEISETRTANYLKGHLLDKVALPRPHSEGYKRKGPRERSLG